MEKLLKSHLFYALVGYTLVIVAVFWKILPPSSDQLIFGDDIHRSYYFFSQYLASSIKDGFIPWWNPYMFAGTPFIANPITNAFYPVNWLFLFLPASVVYLVSIMLHLLIAMSGMYMLIFKFQISNFKFNFGAWAAGLTFGLSSFFASRVYAGHIDVISSASYMPWVVYLFSKAMETRKSKDIVVAGFILALQLFAGYQTMTLFTLIAVGFWALVKKSIASLRVVAVGILIGLGLSAVALLPIQQFAGLSIRTFEKPYQWSSAGSLGPSELVQLISPFALGDQYTYRGSPPNYWEHAIFIGRIGFVLAVLGLFVRRKSHVLFIGSMGVIVFGLWVSLGSNAAIDLNYWLWSSVPVYHFLRIPSRHLLLVVFGLGVLVAYGLTFFQNRWIQRSLIILMTIEMILYAQHFIGTKDIPETRHDKELIAHLTPLPMCRDSSTSGVYGDCLFRLLPNFGVWVEPRDSLDFDSVMEYKIFSTTGYDSTLLRNYYEFIDAVNGAQNPSILSHDVQVPYTDIFRANWNILNVKYMLVPTYIDPLGGKSNDQFTLRKENVDKQYRMYEYKNPIPRFFFADSRLVDSREVAYELIRTQSVNLSKEVLIEAKHSPPNVVCPYQSSQKVTVRSYTPNRIHLSVTSPCQSILTSSEVMYPGWEARVDGKKTDLFEGNLAFRTLVVPAGTHTIDLYYSPKIFMYGGLVSAATLLGCVLWLRRSGH